MVNLNVPYFYMTPEEIFEYKEQLLPKSIKGIIQYQNRYDDSKYPNIKTTRVLEKIEKSNKLNLIAILIPIEQQLDQKLKVENSTPLPEKFSFVQDEDLK